MELLITVLMWLFRGCGLLDISIFEQIKLNENRDEADFCFIGGLAESITLGL